MKQPKLNKQIKVQSFINHDPQAIKLQTTIGDEMLTHIVDLQDNAITQALKDLGWTPPNPKAQDAFIVWNKPRNEGVVFLDVADARHAAGIKKVRQLYSSLADSFNEMYADEGALKVEKVKL